jgi:hypothetical protein
MSSSKENGHIYARDWYEAPDTRLPSPETAVYTNIEVAITKATGNVASLVATLVDEPA